MAEQRYRVDCGKIPSDIGCTLVIEGPEDDLLDVAVMHAKAQHGHTDPDEEIRAMVKASLEPV